MNLEGTRFATTPCALCRKQVVECTYPQAKGTALIDPVPVVGGTIKLQDVGAARLLATRLSVRDQATHAWGSLHQLHTDTCEKRRR